MKMSEKKQRMVIVFLATLTTALLVSSCFAAEGETVKLKGVVSVVRDANDVITSVLLVTDEGTYNVELDEKGKELGENMEDEKAQVEGVVSEVDNQKWLKVLTFSPVEE
jgi:hypothetical protein